MNVIENEIIKENKENIKISTYKFLSFTLFAIKVEVNTNNDYNYTKQEGSKT